MKLRNKPAFVGNRDSTAKDPNKSSAALISEKLNDDLLEKIASGEMDLSEAAGNFALSSLLTQLSAGLLSSKDEFAVLKMLANSKTQNPVQRVEQTHKVDLKVSIAAAIAENAPAFESSLALAKKYNEEILEKLGGNLMLDGDTKEEVAAINPGEPYELRDLRSGGDGSVKIMTFRERMNQQASEQAPKQVERNGGSNEG